MWHGAVLCAAMAERPRPVLWLRWPIWGTAPWPVAALALLPKHTLARGVCWSELALRLAALAQNQFSWSLKGCWSAGLSPVISVGTNLGLCTGILCFLVETLLIRAVFSVQQVVRLPFQVLRCCWGWMWATSP